MVDETRQILEMLSNGTLTAEQAAELLDALDDRPATPPPPPRRAPSREREHRKRLRMNPALEKLAEARLHGVDADYIREMHEAGFGALSLEELTELRVHGVDPDFVREMGDLGLTDLSAEEIIELRIHGVDPEFVHEMRNLGFGDLTPSQFAELKMSGMDTDFLQEMGRLGYLEPGLAETLAARAGARSSEEESPEEELR